MMKNHAFILVDDHESRTTDLSKLIPPILAIDAMVLKSITIALAL